MLSAALLIAAICADDFQPRMAVLEKHLECLSAIVVPEELTAEKESKLAEMRTLLDQGASSNDEVNQKYLAMDEIRTWLLAHASDRPFLADGTFEDTSDSWMLKTPQLTLKIVKADLAMSVTTPAAVWAFAPADKTDIQLGDRDFSFTDAAEKTAEAFKTGHSTGMTITLKGYDDFPEQRYILGIHITGNEVRFSVTSPEDAMDFETIQWPKALIAGTAPDELAVIPTMQGMLIPGGWNESIERRDQTNSRTLYMPWWAQLQANRGVLTILESSDDGGVHYTHAPGEATRIRPLWYSSLRKMRYQRWVLYVFDDDATYVSFAKRFRRYVQETGRFVSLKEKCVRTPNLSKILGRPVVHVGALYHNVPQSHYYNKETLEANHALVPFDDLAAQLRGLKEKGIAEAYVHLDGWGFYGYDNGHPDVIPAGYEQGGWDGLRRFADTCDELGWIFAVHDQYRDYYLNAVSFDRKLALMRADGGFEEHSTWCGGPQTFLSAIHAPGYVRRNHDAFIEHGIKIRGAYLDVFSIVPLEESFQEANTMTRTQCAEYRKQCFDLLRSRGYVISSEEPVDRFTPDLDLVHHGPYFFFNEKGLTGIPAPLFELVYHDSILLPWSTDDAGGWGIPPGDAGWLHCLLNAGMPYVSPSAEGESLERVQTATKLSQRCALSEMAGHEFLDETHRKQRSTFSDGTVVTVDFDAKTFSITPDLN